MNGTTFRRTSTQSRDTLYSTQTTSTGPYIPPHLNQQGGQPRNGTVTGGRYAKEDLLDVYNAQKDAGLIGNNLGSIFAGPWDPSTGSSWTGRSDSKDPGAEVCWNAQPDTIPLAFRDMDENEKQVGSTTISR